MAGMVACVSDRSIVRTSRVSDLPELSNQSTGINEQQDVDALRDAIHFHLVVAAALMAARRDRGGAHFSPEHYRDRRGFLSQHGHSRQ